MGILADKKPFRYILPAVVAAVLLLALGLLYNALREYRYHDIVAHLGTYSKTVILAALAFTVLNYVVLSLYDVLALRYVGEKLQYRRAAFTSFLSYVFSFNIGLSIFGSSALRLRFYSMWGIDSGKIAKIVTFCIVTFWVGLAAAGGVALLTGPQMPPSLEIFRFSSRILGVVLLAATLAYLVASASGKASVSFRRFSVSLPSFKIALAQILVASIDWCLAAWILYILLPEGKPPFPHFLAVYMIAQLAAATSHVPGGIGVLETVLVLSLSSFIPPAALFGSILAYRGIYYLFPLAVAVVAFTAREAWGGRKKVAGIAASAARAAAPVVPALLSAAVFVAGAVLLLSSATPAMAQRLEALDAIIPLALLETSHFAASLVGLALLLVADALRRRVDAAYWFSLGLLVAGAVFSLLKGFEWEQGLFLLAVAGLIVPSRRLFHRHTVLLTRPENAWWLIAVTTVLAASVWIGFFAFKHVQYSNELWWQFELSRGAPRFLRASLGVGLAVAIVGLRILLGSKPRLPKERLADCEQDVRRILGVAECANSNLALLDDKFFHFGAERQSFLMYAVKGSTCIVMGDPVGAETEFADLLWDFYELVRRQGVRVAWYEISAIHLPLFVDLGLKVFKIGEEAIVDLEEFTLNGGRGKRLRPPCNKMEKDGYSFAVLTAEDAILKMPELRAVSDQWMAAKKAKEKGFSLGYFDEKYLANFPLATVTKDGRVVAFANLWTSGGKHEAAIDLMRHSDDAPNGTMEYLFVRSIEWAKENGFRGFNLGIAPFSGVEDRQAAPFWNKAVSLIFRTGEGIYNFQGLRAFKSKFLPRWFPRYIAAGNGTSLAMASADIALLVSQNRRGE